MTSDLRCAYLPLDGLHASTAPWKASMLGVVGFSMTDMAHTMPASRAPLARVPMPALDITGAAAAACEIWAADGNFSYGVRGALQYGHNDTTLFGVIQLPEAQFAAHDDDIANPPLRRASEYAYREIFALLDALAFPHVLRLWNYMADINGHSHDIERYRQFNMGRQDGFLASGRHVTGSVPAASAVGFTQGPLTIYFLAARGAAPVAIENPRQVSAYQYPQQYGPRSPTFSRASVAHVGGRDVLFLSGTASIVGHQTLHIGDVAAQTRETIANISAMIGEANRVAPQARFTLGDLCYKVYVRREADVPTIHQVLCECLGSAARMMFLKADICRQDLLMEIEATAGHPLEFSIAA